jgi:hypothetical protein
MLENRIGAAATLSMITFSCHSAINFILFYWIYKIHMEEGTA